VLGGFLLWTTLDPFATLTVGPLVLIALGAFQVWRGFRPPPRTDFYAT
jgi:hypothetical protein